ncbi:MAG: sugar ABC transporter substrate-binding protein [Actinomycetota bacterium]
MIRRDAVRAPRGLFLALPAAIVAVALVLAGCGGGSSSTSSSAPAESSGSESSGSGESSKSGGSGITIGFDSALDCSNAVVCQMQKAFAAEAEELGAKPIVLESNVNDLINNQISNMDQLTSEDVDAIAIWPQDESALLPPMKRAEEAGIPVFAHEVYEPSQAGIVTDILEGRKLVSKQAAEQVCQRAPSDGGEILFGAFALPNPGIEILEKSFESNLGECESEVKVTKFLNKTDNVAGARPTAEAALQNSPNAFAVEAYNDPTAEGAALAAEQLGNREDLFIMGYNLGPEGVEAVEQGRIDMSWDYRAAVVGQTLAKLMVEYAEGNEEPAKVVTVWPKCYDESNIASHPSPEEQIAAIKSGEDLSKEDPKLFQESEEPVEPSDSLPGCE